jgi:CRISPR-associated protein Cas5t
MMVFYLKVKAPFASYRPLQNSFYQNTFPVMPPSAAYGLLLNLAGIETRNVSIENLPKVKVAIGQITPAGTGVVYQQLHSYPVGNSSKANKEKCHGQKYHIAPAHREILINLDVVIGVQTDDFSLLDLVLQGLDGKTKRYGLPFAGDSSFLFEELKVLYEPTSANWYVRLDEGSKPLRKSCRLNVNVDRKNNTKTSWVLCAPHGEKLENIPEEAWVSVPS